jgi:hypothetical protein
MAIISSESAKENRKSHSDKMALEGSGFYEM